MILVTAGFKGGISKSLCSVFIGFSDKINAEIYTNDINGLYHEVFEKYNYTDDLKSTLDNIKKDKNNKNYVFDLGGFSADIGDLISQADVLLIPSLSDINTIKTTLDTVEELRKYNNNILIVESMYKGDTLLEDAISENFNDDYPILKLRYSKIFDNALRASQSVHDFVKGDKLKQITYKNVLGDMDDIIEAVSILGGLNGDS